jgi:hypothetical protein
MHPGKVRPWILSPKILKYFAERRLAAFSVWPCRPDTINHGPAGVNRRGLAFEMACKAKSIAGALAKHIGKEG